MNSSVWERCIAQLGRVCICHIGKICILHRINANFAVDGPLAIMSWLINVKLAVNFVNLHHQSAQSRTAMLCMLAGAEWKDGVD